MAELYLFAEGRTEQTFASVVLAPHLEAHEVYMRGRIDVGGGPSYARIARPASAALKQHTRPGVFFTTMLDLYALYRDFPGRAEAAGLRDPYSRVRALEQSWADDVDDPRFIPHIQLHEYEALLFVAPGEFSGSYPGSEKQIARLQAIADAHASPELIDDGVETSPSKRITVELAGYAGPKAAVGPLVAARIGLPAIRAKCPHFDAWVSRLEALGGE
jgi:hypothetical protein